MLPAAALENLLHLSRSLTFADELGIALRPILHCSSLTHSPLQPSASGFHVMQQATNAELSRATSSWQSAARSEPAPFTRMAANLHPAQLGGRPASAAHRTIPGVVCVMGGFVSEAITAAENKASVIELRGSRYPSECRQLSACLPPRPHVATS